MRKVLPPSYFNKPGIQLARNLLGKFLVRRRTRLIRTNKPRMKSYRETALMITEVEVYDGFDDKASHARSGKTKRNYPMYGEAGRWYVYFTYGMHFMLNIVIGAKDYPSAILIRGTDKIIGPARLTKFLKIDRRLNDMPANKKSGLWIEDRGTTSKKLKSKSQKYKIIATPRIGIAHSGPVWSKKKLRFVLRADNLPK